MSVDGFRPEFDRYLETSEELEVVMREVEPHEWALAYPEEGIFECRLCGVRGVASPGDKARRLGR